MTTSYLLYATLIFYRTLIRKNAARIVDVRKEEEYREGHIPTAVSLPLAQVLSKDSPEGVVGISREYWSFPKAPCHSV